MLEQVLKENSHKYLAMICQIAGIACSSGLGTKIINAAVAGDFEQLSLDSFSLQLCIFFLLIGLISFTVGWYIMFRVDVKKAGLKSDAS